MYHWLKVKHPEWKMYLYFKGKGKDKNKAHQDTCPDRVGIHKRPAYINKRIAYGHYEVDLIVGPRSKGYILTIYERKARYGLVRFLPEKTASSTALAIKDAMSGIKVHSVTFDNGKEFFHHYEVAKFFTCKTYFCRVGKPTDKGGVENFNRRVWKYIKKDQCFRSLSLRPD